MKFEYLAFGFAAVWLVFVLVILRRILARKGPGAPAAVAGGSLANVDPDFTNDPVKDAIVKSQWVTNPEWRPVLGISPGFFGSQPADH